MKIPMKKNNNPKKQHFLPEMFLDGFTNENGQIFLLDKKKKEPQLRNPKTVACQMHLYTIINGQDKSYAVEEKLSSIESDMAPLIKRISSFGFKNITGPEINKLIDFIALNFVRTPMATAIAEKVSASPKVLSEMKEIDRIKATERIDLWQRSKGLVYADTLPGLFKDQRDKILLNCNAYLLTSEDEALPFVINDMYSCLKITDLNIPYTGEDVDWSRINGARHYPVSNKHCVSFYPKTDPSKKGTHIIQCTEATISKRDVSIINRLSTDQANRYAFSSSKYSFYGSDNSE